MTPKDASKTQEFCARKNCEVLEARRLAQLANPPPTYTNPLKAYCLRLREAAHVRAARKEADRLAAGILTKEEQRAQREAWLREEYGQ